MKKRKIVKDETIPIRVDIKEFYESNPSAISLSNAFNLKCKKCGGKYVLIGFNWYGKVDNGIEVKGKRYQVVAPMILCLECRNYAESVALANTDEGEIMVGKKEKELKK